MRNSNQTSRDFIAKIREEVYSGHGFVPLIGSGMSAPSGILMGMEFDNYLAYTVWRVVVDDHWNLKKDGWPKYPRDDEIATVRTWTYAQFTKICEEHDYVQRYEWVNGNQLVTEVDFLPGKDSPTATARAVNRPLIPTIIRSRSPETWMSEKRAREFQRKFRGSDNRSSFDEGDGFSRTSQSYLFERAIRSMYDWRATLQFLSLTQYDPGADRIYVKDDEPDASIIDGFNVHITRDRQINLGHKMISHLVRPMRIRTLLTTNFDHLIEQAFARLLIPLQVIPVSVKGSMPHDRTVRSQNTLVKLHGESIETRSDFTLDDEPSLADKESFSRYVRGEFDQSEKTAAIPNHMIVMGFSGSDMRIIQMMKYLLDTRKDVIIFWICYADDEIARIKKVFGAEYDSRLCYYQTNRPDLFLYEVYQELTLCLPSGGFSYEFTHKVPPQPLGESLQVHDDDAERIKKGEYVNPYPPIGLQNDEAVLRHRKGLRRVISNAIGEHVADTLMSGTAPEKLFRFPQDNPLAIIQWCGEKDAGLFAKLFISSGGAGAMSEAFARLTSRGIHCLWLELQDYADAGSVGQEILRIIALRVGFFQLEHIVLHPGQDSTETQMRRHVKGLLKMFGISDRKWCVFLYGRDVPGSCASWDNGPWQTDDYKGLHELIKCLTECGIQVVYLPLTKERVESDKEKLSIVDENWMKEKMLDYRVGKRKMRKRKRWEDATAKIKKQERDARGLIQPDPEVQCPESNLSDNPFLLYGCLRDAALQAWLNPFRLHERLRRKDSSTGKIHSPKEMLQMYVWRLKFLYSATLFRQSRHTSAFFSDAVYSCPKRFNTQGIDNDWHRAEQVRDWINELGELDVFFYKPGGYSWKYRDIRLGLQTSLEALPLFEYWEPIATIFGVAEPNKVKPPGPEFFRQSRARTHFWIGDWYFKAFAATGHYLPVVESLYHRLECLTHSIDAKPSRLDYDDPDQRKTCAQYRIVLARSAMMEMIKTIRIARPWMKFWLSNVDGYSMFEQSQAIQYCLNGIKKELKPEHGTDNWSHELHTIQQSLLSELDAIQRSLKGEAGHFIGKKWLPPSLVEPVGKDAFTEKIKDNPPTTVSLSSENCVARRDFVSAFRKWFVALDSVYINNVVKKFHGNGNALDANETLKKEKNEWIFRNLKETAQDPTQKTQDNVALLRLVQLVSDFAYLFIKRANLEFNATGNWDEKSRRRWGQATILCFLGIDLCKHLHPQFFQSELKLKIKMHTLYGLSLAYLDRPFEASRHFNEAKALLSKAARTLDEVEVAIIRLRQAEAYLVQATHISKILDAIPKGAYDIVNDDQLRELREQQDAILKDPKSELARHADKIKKHNIVLSSQPDDISRKDLIDQILDRLSSNSVFGHCLKPDDNSSNSQLLVDPLVRYAFEECNKRTIETKEFRSELLTRLNRLHSATLDDAWVSLESSEKLLAGYSQSSLWWGNLASLKLRAYAQVRPNATFESLVFRRKVQHDEAIRQLLQRLVLISPGSLYARVCAVDLVSLAMLAITQQNAATVGKFKSKDWDEVEELLQEDDKDFALYVKGKLLLKDHYDRVKNACAKRRKQCEVVD